MALPETELLSETRRPDVSSLSARAPRAGPLQTTLGFGSKEKQFAQAVGCPPAQARGSGRPIPSGSFPRHLTGIGSADVRERAAPKRAFPFACPPGPGETRQVAPGIRPALPFRLDHVNIHLIDRKGRWVVPDTGLGAADPCGVQRAPGWSACRQAAHAAARPGGSAHHAHPARPPRRPRRVSVGPIWAGPQSAPLMSINHDRVCLDLPKRRPSK
jgi:hypothetical protein